MDEQLKERLTMLALKWKARAEELEAEADQPHIQGDARGSRHERAALYRLCARELIKEAGLPIQL